MLAMRGVMRSLCVLLSVLLLSVACCNGKKLWGVDVGKKEEVCVCVCVCVGERTEKSTKSITPGLAYADELRLGFPLRKRAAQRSAFDVAVTTPQDASRLRVALAEVQGLD